jgi:hypothetical protein
MTTISFFFKEPCLMSPRTAKYVEAMVREDFDFNEWLKEVREEEAGATSTSGELAAAEIDKTPDNQQARPNPALRLITRTMRVPRTLRRPHLQAKSQTTKARLRQWLEKVQVAWEDFQSSRRRDAVYEYLGAVFAIVMHYRVRRRTTRLLRQAFELADLPFDKSADPFTAVIRCTCGDGADNKAISKWSRALRFASRRKEPDARLKTFMKEVGGVNACAAAYAKS